MSCRTHCVPDNRACRLALRLPLFLLHQLHRQDDLRYLSLLRRFLPTLSSHFPDPDALICFHLCIPALLHFLRTDPARAPLMHTLYHSFYLPIFHHLENLQPDEALHLYRRLVSEASRLLLHVLHA